MVYSVTLAPLMEKAQKEMMDVMQSTGLSDEDKFNKWTGILNNLVGDAINQQDLANRLLEEYQKSAADKGFDIFSPDKDTSQSSTKKGLATASQDSIDELNGRFTAGLIAWEETKNQAIEQTSLLYSINEKMSAICAPEIVEGSTGVPNIEVPSDGLREMLVSSLAQQSDYSGKFIEHIVSLKGEVANLGNTLSQMEEKQVQWTMNFEIMAENSGVLAKNSPKILSYADEIKRNTGKL